MNRKVLAALGAVLLVAGVGASPWQGFSALALAPDGRTFATGGRGGEVWLWETSTGEPQTRWVLPQGLPVVGLAFGPPDGRLAAASLDGSLAILDPGLGAGNPSPPVDPPWRSLSWARDRWVAVGAHRSWSFFPSSGPHPLDAGAARPGDPAAPPSEPLASPRVEAGDLWAVGTPGGKITVGKLSDGLVLVSWQAHAAAVTGLALASDGSFLLSCSYDGSLARWDPRTGRLFGRL